MTVFHELLSSVEKISTTVGCVFATNTLTTSNSEIVTSSGSSDTVTNYKDKAYVFSRSGMSPTVDEFDISTNTLARVGASYTFNVTGLSGTIGSNAAFIKEDGMFLFMNYLDTSEIIKIQLTSPFDFASGGTIVQRDGGVVRSYFGIGTGLSYPSMTMTSDGSNMYVRRAANLAHFRLSVPFDLTTAVGVNIYPVATDSMSGMTIQRSNEKLYHGRNGIWSVDINPDGTLNFATETLIQAGVGTYGFSITDDCRFFVRNNSTSPGNAYLLY